MGEILYSLLHHTLHCLFMKFSVLSGLRRFVLKSEVHVNNENEFDWTQNTV